MKTHYFFILGTGGVKAYNRTEDPKEIAEAIDYHGGDLVVFNINEHTPQDIVEAVIGWHEAEEIFPSEYHNIKAHLNSKK